MRCNPTTHAGLASVTLLLAGCSGQDIASYADKEPLIKVQDFYSAPVEGYGIFQDRSGQVKDRYYATLVPKWNGSEGTLVEKQWNDKGKLFFEQTWHIHVAANGSDFTATATKIDGGVQGAARGFAMHMIYVSLVPTDKGSDIKLDADDWTYLQPDGSGINKVALGKYGIHVGDVTYDLHKVPDGETIHEGYFEP